MPVWQQHYAELKAYGADLLSVAVDLQGPERPQCYHDGAGAEFVTVVDEQNVLAGLFGYRAIPNGFFIDETGVLRYRHVSGFNIAKPGTVEDVLAFAADGKIPTTGNIGLASEFDYFERGLERYHAGDLEAAKRIWLEGASAEPDNWNLRKQLWAIENPEKFYGGRVDYGWQREQLALSR